ncbi:hypothetical protein ACFV2L_05265 [Streptomyces sp. NPDC059687]|uniref:hypothetical protein n=1 Tax=Streptomyces sp. NPDC059687 TaxID=3346905 RepID=UPI0036A3ED85
MAPDVVLIADAEGIVAAIRVPIHGAVPVAIFLAHANQVVAFEAASAWLNDTLASGSTSTVNRLRRVSRWRR